MNLQHRSEAIRIIDEYATGKPLMRAVKESGLRWETFWRMRQDDPELRKAYELARDGHAHSLMGVAHEAVMSDGMDARRAGVIGRTLVAIAERTGTEFSPQLRVEQNETVNLLVAMQAGDARLAALSAPTRHLGPVIEAQLIDAPTSFERAPTDKGSDAVPINPFED